MQNLSEILKQFQQKYSKIEETSLAEVVKKIANDEDVRHFWAENQTKLRQDAFQLKMMDLHEFVQQKERIAHGEKSLYPGYYPQLAIEKGYPHVRYVAEESTQKQLMQAEKLTSYKMPKAIRDADLQTIVVDSGRANVVTSIVDILTQLLKKDDAYVQGLYLYGEFGVGKTYLMGALANALAANNIDVMLVHFPSFAVDLKNTIGKNSDVREKLIMQTKTTTVLILDDLGAENLSMWIRDDILGVILEYRMQNELTTFITSNFDMNEMTTYLSETRDDRDTGKAARLMQRIKFLTRLIEVNGKNRRLEN
ncbi:MAG: primosomal protein DnaI [Leuconostoc gelidum]|jgi:primosomal protein DnaI|uniref:primosomal protein DnaI n=1 Tax=Leuconostoc gelidum TaxID=1244 RepID=UPI0002193C56|nr:primosomal protein DnaI [Leuconostoc gelidum]AFS40901.1 primosomal protein DnaI [Leuconostoc gelidum JB7]MBZ5978983.1 primosomal protein DnaI [Leuconostoc gelidum subsp. gelidum]MBZ5992955.1 primosomal protein DnaI [Leuconostoc gelidum subsp. gelidum]MBZ6000735.1 primosomal protein DnaI [Leuconostoc gelidum subsp. gelidum]MBZ6014734.1 primosomal protein DnaI [Leuconostoc gelidum subsp. gelidum]